MLRFEQAALMVIAAVVMSAPGLAETNPREATDVYIRRLAGLPAASAKGQIEIIDVGHDPLSKMISIVGNRGADGWSVSFACAASPHCAPGADHLAKSYALSPIASTQVDDIVKSLSSGTEPDGQPPVPWIIGGQLLIVIDYRGFKREYRRVAWGKTLGRLEELMSPQAK